MKLLLSLLSLGLSLGMATEAAADAPSVHGMLLFGKTQPYFSHLPMFHRPHDYQAIFAVKFAPGVFAAYVADAEANPKETVYTVVPHSLSLPDLAAANPKPFFVVIYRGHFERGGVPITRPTQVEISKVIHFRKFDAAAKPASELTYFAFGDQQEAYLAHYITAAPDFDQIVRVKGRPGHGKGFVVEGDPAKPLSEGASIQIAVGRRLDKYVVEKQLYLEFDDLKH